MNATGSYALETLQDITLMREITNNVVAGNVELANISPVVTSLLNMPKFAMHGAEENNVRPRWHSITGFGRGCE